MGTEPRYPHRPFCKQSHGVVFEDMAIVLRGCPPELWEAGMWEVKKTDEWAWPPTDREGRPFDDPEVRERKLFGDLTDDRAAAPLPESHRNREWSFGQALLGVLHLQRHSVEVRTFLRSQGVRCADE